MILVCFGWCLSDALEQAVWNFVWIAWMDSNQSSSWNLGRLCEESLFCLVGFATRCLQFKESIEHIRRMQQHVPSIKSWTNDGSGISWTYDDMVWTAQVRKLAGCGGVNKYVLKIFQTHDKFAEATHTILLQTTRFRLYGPCGLWRALRQTTVVIGNICFLRNMLIVAETKDANMKNHIWI